MAHSACTSVVLPARLMQAPGRTALADPAISSHSAASLPEPSNTTGKVSLCASSEKCAAGQRLAGPYSAPGAKTS